MRAPSVPKATPLRLLIVAIWLVFASLFGAVMINSSSTGASPTSPHLALTTAAPATTSAAADCSSNAHDPTQGSSACLTVDPGMTAAPMACNPDRYPADCLHTYQADPTALLPAWRWWSTNTITSNPGGADQLQVVLPLFNFLASFCFDLASLIWLALLSLISWALSLSLITLFAKKINHEFVAVASSLLGSGIFWILATFAAIVMVRLLLRGKITKVVSTALVLIIPIGTVWALADAASSGTDAIPKGSPAWLAVQGSGYVDQVGGSLATGLGALSNTGAGAAVISAAGANNPNCPGYVAALYDQYYTYSSPAVQNMDFIKGEIITSHNWQSFQTARSGSIGLSEFLQSSNRTGLTTLSYLWQRAYLSTWVSAQYGSEVQGVNLYCRQLERDATVSPGEQWALTMISGSYDGANTYKNISPRVFVVPGTTTAEDRANRTADLFAWAACTDKNGTFSATNGWQWYDSKGVDNANQTCKEYFTSNPSDQSQTLKGIYGLSNEVYSLYGVTGGVGGGVVADVGNTVTGWWENITGISANATLNGGGSPAFLSYGDGAALGRSHDTALQTMESAGLSPSSAAAASDQINIDQQAMMSSWGHNFSAALLEGILALITAVIYIYALGALALGTVIAQFGLVVMLMLLPATLFLLAIPNREGGRVRSGVTLLRTTFGFLVSKLTLSITLLLLLQCILLFEAVAPSWTGAMAGLVDAVIPLICLYLIKKLLSALGMGNLTSLSGALGMPLAAAMTASGSNTLKGNVMGGFNKAMDKTGINKADKLAKRAGKAPFKALGKGISAGAKAGSKWAGLPDLKTQLFGKKNAAGQRTELGMAQRLKSLAGLLDMAKNNRVTGNAAKSFLGSGVGARINAYAKNSDLLRGHGSAEQAKLAMSRRRELMAATRFKGRHARIAAVREFMENSDQGLLTNQRAIRDSSGNIVRDASGAAVFGYRQGRLRAADGAFLGFDSSTGKIQMDGSGDPIYGFDYTAPNGSVQRLGFNQYRALSKTERANCVPVLSQSDAGIIPKDRLGSLSPEQRSTLEAVTRLEDVLDPQDLEDYSIGFLDRYGLRDGQAVFSRFGHDGILNPKMGDMFGRGRIINTKKFDTTAEMAKMAINFIPDYQKVRPPGFTDTQWNVALHLMNESAGGYDPDGRIVDVLADHGIMLDSEAGRVELQMAIAGQSSALDDIQLSVPDAEYRAILARAREYGRGGTEQVRADIINKNWEEAAIRTASNADGYKANLEHSATVVETASQNLRGNMVGMNGARNNYTKAQSTRLTLTDQFDSTLSRAPEDISSVLASMADLQVRRASTTSTAEIAGLDEAISQLRLAHGSTIDDNRSTVDQLEKLRAALDAAADEEKKYARQIKDYEDKQTTLVQTINASMQDSYKNFTLLEDASEELSTMFEISMASNGRKGRLGTTDMSVIFDTLDRNRKIKQGQWMAISSELDGYEADIMKILKDESSDPVMLQKSVESAVKALSSLNRSASRRAEDAIGLQSKTLANVQELLSPDGPYNVPKPGAARVSWAT